ncbi:hypothetical protein [Microbispora catharanthi]|uniref:DUF4258 domain-containing protein n=1 Tax=Microbispora catharanthi TaxID=1712871 RepID=A0A5N6BPI2_9ACTN|nr:hypothetical protein [Microbispora catharanthi]KAB8182168.1 hypothetical protein FH610_024835 [Microbispora catharanthi]
MAKLLRVTPQSLRVITEWRERAAVSDRGLIDELLSTLDDEKTWEKRWHSADYPADRSIKVVSPRKGLWVYLRFPIGAVDIITISYGNGDEFDGDFD